MLISLEFSPSRLSGCIRTLISQFNITLVAKIALMSSKEFLS